MFVLRPITPPSQPMPAVSVIVPMYNVEKYIAETLDSILNQTFQDFEVIVVNDCSTDNSRAIAESYLERFGGRMTLLDNEKNSGPSPSRNNGLRRAKGEYVFFMDADDLLLPNSLEEMYKFAAEYNVDFINCTANYQMSEDGKESILKRYALKIVPTIIIEENMERRIEILLRQKPSWAPWRRFLRREFLIENELFFLENIRLSEDRIWTYGLYLCAKKFLQLPKPYVSHRMSQNSLTRTKKPPLRKAMDCFTALICGIKWIDNVMRKLEYFKQNPEIRFIVLESVVSMFSNFAFKYSVKLKSHDIYEAIKQEFTESLGDNDVLIAQLITYTDTQRKRIVELEDQLKTINN